MESKTGSILSLIGGILWLVFSIIFIIGCLVAVILTLVKDYEWLVFGIIFLVIGIFFIVYGTLAIKASQWMKDDREIKKGGIVALIIGILGLNALVIVAGILGLVDSGKK